MIDAETLAEALFDLLQDSQHSDHNCGDAESDCPVLRAKNVLDAWNAQVERIADVEGSPHP